MNTIINIFSVTDRSGELPIVTYSNPVTTVIRANPPAPTMTSGAAFALQGDGCLHPSPCKPSGFALGRPNQAHAPLKKSAKNKTQKNIYGTVAGA